jgi:hypothetical protein
MLSPFLIEIQAMLFRTAQGSEASEEMCKITVSTADSKNFCHYSDSTQDSGFPKFYG